MGDVINMPSSPLRTIVWGSVEVPILYRAHADLAHRVFNYLMAHAPINTTTELPKRCLVARDVISRLPPEGWPEKPPFALESYENAGEWYMLLRNPDDTSLDFNPHIAAAFAQAIMYATGNKSKVGMTYYEIPTGGVRGGWESFYMDGGIIVFTAFDLLYKDLDAMMDDAYATVSA